MNDDDTNTNLGTAEEIEVEEEPYLGDLLHNPDGKYGLVDGDEPFEEDEYADYEQMSESGGGVYECSTTNIYIEYMLINDIYCDLCGERREKDMFRLIQTEGKGKGWWSDHELTLVHICKDCIARPCNDSNPVILQLISNMEQKIEGLRKLMYSSTK